MALHGFRPGSAGKRRLLTACILIAPIGCVLGLAGSAAGNHATGATGMGIELVTLFGVIFGRFIQPLQFDSLSVAQRDERDAALWNGAHAKGWLIPAAFGMRFFLYMGTAVDTGWWVPVRSTDWFMLGELNMIWFKGLPTTVASWQISAPLEEDDDQ